MTGPPAGPDAFDAVVVGAGPAGSAAALELARAGRSVALLERGPYPGSKNAYGGVIYPRILDTALPDWRDTAPVQRWVVRRSTMLMHHDRAVTLDVHCPDWGRPPYNGMTAHRADFDTWLADQAVAAGAHLLTSTTATGLLRDPAGRVNGVTTDRGDQPLRARVVIACDGVNSLLAKQAGLLPRADADTHTLGVKEVLTLPRHTIDERFGLHPTHGADIEMLGCTLGIPGGGFLYTNTDTLAVGAVLSLRGLQRTRTRPEHVIDHIKAHPAIAPLLRDTTVKEYTAHLIPEGGYDHIPTLATDGLLIAGDAAHLTLAAGLWLEGVNFALGSGLAAGRTAARATAAGDTTARAMADYRRHLDDTFVLADHRRLRRAPALVLSDRVQNHYPALATGIAHDLFTVTNPHPKPGITALLRRAARRNGIRLRHLAADTARAWRVFR